MEFLSHPMTNLFIQTALWMIPIFMFLSAVKLLPHLRGKTGEELVGQALERCSPYVLHDILIADGKGGMTQLEHVLLTAKGLLVVETNHNGGMIYGNPRDRHWTQRLGRSSRRFINPLRQNQLQVKALQALNLGVPVSGRVVFTDQAQFPKGRPIGVSQINGLRDDLAEQRLGKPGTSHRGAWFQLERLSRAVKPARKAPPPNITDKQSEDRRTLTAYALLGTSLAWSFILWLNTPIDIPASLVTETLPSQPIQTRPERISTEPHLLKAASTSPSNASRGIVGYRQEWVAGRSLEECLGPDRRFDSTVLRCRQGHQRRVPVFND